MKAESEVVDVPEEETEREPPGPFTAMAIDMIKGLLERYNGSANRVQVEIVRTNPNLWISPKTIKNYKDRVTAMTTDNADELLKVVREQLPKEKRQEFDAHIKALSRIMLEWSR